MSDHDTILDTLASLDLDAQEPSSKRAKLADSKKNQTETLRACSARDLQSLCALLEQGMSPNFFSQRMGSLHSPLSFCQLERWSEGVDALLAAGAQDSALGVASWSEEGVAATAIQMAADQGDLPAFKKLWTTETSPALRELSLHSLRHKPALALWLLSSPDRAFISLPIATKIFAGHLGLLGSRSEPAEEAMVELLKLRPECSPYAEACWKAVIDHDAAALARALARSGKGLTASRWTLNMKAEDFPNHYHGCAPAEMVKRDSRYYGYQTLSARLNPGVISLSALRGSSQVLSLLLRVTPLKTSFSTDSDGHKALSFTRSPEALKLLLDAGLDLSLIKDSTGNTPLHHACQFSYGKKTVEGFCRLNQDWASQKNNAGKRPIELATDKDVSDYAVIIDKAGLRDVIKGRKGKRTGEAAKPRRL